MSTPSSTSRNYTFSYDVIRCLAVLGIIAIHVFYPVYARTDFIGGLSWWGTYLVNILARPSVPLFIILSGALLLSHKDAGDVKRVATKAIVRVLLPLVVWSGIYIWWETKNGSVMNPGIFWEMVGTGNLYHLYFLIILLPLYLHVPGFSALFSTRSKSLISYTLALGFTLEILMGLLEFFVFKNTAILNSLTYWVPYVGYFLFGRWAIEQKFSVSQLRIWLLAYIISFCATLALGYLSLKQLSVGNLLFWKTGGLDYFTDYLSPTVTVNAVSLFVLVTHFFRNYQNSSYLFNKIIKPVVFQLARASFGMYLVHSIVLNVVMQSKVFSQFSELGPLWLPPMITLTAVVVISFILIALLRRIPLLRLSIGEK